MRILLCVWFSFPIALAAQTSGTCANPFEAAAIPDREISMTLRSGDVTITGRGAPGLRVSCVLDGAGAGGHLAREIRITFAAGHLTIRGGPDEGVHFRIEVPNSMNLVVRCSAGDLNIFGIKGDKDIALNAGNMTIEVGNSGDYRHAEASVLAGNLNAEVFGAVKDGLFRSFRTDSPRGRYRLHAQLLAGNLALK
jgi:hypothetical protein